MLAQPVDPVILRDLGLDIDAVRPLRRLGVFFESGATLSASQARVQVDMCLGCRPTTYYDHVTDCYNIYLSIYIHQCLCLFIYLYIWKRSPFAS